MEYSTLSFCIYYAIESFHNDREYASQAILKHNICTGERSYWYKPSHFPTEPFFIPRQKGTAPGSEDDGVVTFAVTDGTTGDSYLLVVDGKDFSKTLVEQKLSMRVTFATHGEWFEGMVTDN